MSTSETLIEVKKLSVEKLSHEQDHKPSQRHIVEMLVGVSGMTNTQDGGNDDALWNACPFLAAGHASKGCSLKWKKGK